MAKAGVLMALSDLSARKRKIPLFKLYGGVQKSIVSGISLGIQDTPQDLIERIKEAISFGYRRIKIKIKQGWDLKVVALVRKEFPRLTLSVDANGAYKAYDWKLFKDLDKYNLMMIEQPLRHDDLVEHAQLQKKIKTPICLDESIKSYHDAEQAIMLKSCKIINIKQARVGGPLEAIQIHNLCRKNKIPVWCGGILESGIGRLHNIALASLPGFTLPADISASSRYYKKDIINPPVTLQADGTIKVPVKIGLGAEIINSQLEEYTVSKEVIS
jgi:O-succinylbenzoate synthase